MSSSRVLPDATGALAMLQAWSHPELCHGFLGRQGGVSAGPFATLNLSYWLGDDPAAVDENWRRVRAIIGTRSAVVRLNQVHGKQVHMVTGQNAAGVLRGDGLVTAETGVILAIFTADCVPVLMLDREQHVAGALHAGWRGALAGIAEAGISAMARAGAQPGRIQIAMGPSIGPCCFEVDEELARRFGREIENAERRARWGRPGKAYLDLRAILADQFAAAGVPRDTITCVGPCTRCACEQYFSRRAASGGICGLQASFVGFRI